MLSLFNFVCVFFFSHSCGSIESVCICLILNALKVVISREFTNLCRKYKRKKRKKLWTNWNEKRNQLKWIKMRKRDSKCFPASHASRCIKRIDTISSDFVCLTQIQFCYICSKSELFLSFSSCHILIHSISQDFSLRIFIYLVEWNKKSCSYSHTFI